MKSFPITLVAIAAAAVFGLNSVAVAGGCGCSSKSGSYEKSDKPNIAEVAQSAGKFNTLLAAAQAADLVPALTGDAKLTVFAPTDEAFAALPEGTVEALLKPENKDKLRAILLYHVVEGKQKAAKVVKMDSATTLFGQAADIRVEDGKAFIDNAQIVKTDIWASNGVVHVIDKVIMPKDIIGVASSNANFSTLVAAVKAAELKETLQGEGPFTVFAPTDNAFAALPKGTVESLLLPENKGQLQSILTYHVVAGDVKAADVVKKQSIKTVNGDTIDVKIKQDAEGNPVVMIDNARVVMTDIPALNGTIHVIDAVVLPAAPTPGTAKAETDATKG